MQNPHVINKPTKCDINIKNLKATQNNGSFYNEIDNIESNLRRNGNHQDSKNSSFIINVSSRAASVGSGEFHFSNPSPKDDEIKESDTSDNDGNFGLQNDTVKKVKLHVGPQSINRLEHKPMLSFNDS